MKFASHKAVEGFDKQCLPGVQEFPIQGARIVSFVDGYALLKQNVPGIDGMLEREGGNARLSQAMNDRPLNGRCAAQLWQHGSVQVDGAKFRGIPHHLRQHAKRNHDEYVGTPGGKRLIEFGVFEVGWLQQGEAVRFR